MINASFSELKELADQLSLNPSTALSQLKKSQKRIQSVIRLPGDASTRRYYRLSSHQTNWILMVTSPFLEQGNHFPFLSVQKHLLTSGVDVPKVIDWSSQQGWILLEDLGDTTLLKQLVKSMPSATLERQLYQRVIDALIHLQIHASQPSSQSPLVSFQLKLDQKKLMEEVDFTLEHFYQIYLKRQWPEEELHTLRASWSEICSFLAQEPTVLAHRDLHSKNIMLAPNHLGTLERVVMIDFQDALMAPPQYDLVSLLKDSYYSLENSQITELVEYYITRYELVSGKGMDKKHFRTLFDYMGLQRNFKAIGSFASFFNKRGDATYLKYIGNTFENIQRGLLHYPQFLKMRNLLGYYYSF